jgi:hypothetical protein
MLTGIRLFELGRDGNMMKLYERIVFGERVLTDYFSPEVMNFVSALMVKTPLKRLGTGKSGAENAKAHPFFKGINWVDVSKDIRMPYQPPLRTNNFQENMSMQILGHNVLLGTRTEVCSYVAPGLITNDACGDLLALFSPKCFSLPFS